MQILTHKLSDTETELERFVLDSRAPTQNASPRKFSLILVATAPIFGSIVFFREQKSYGFDNWLFGACARSFVDHNILQSDLFHCVFVMDSAKH